MVERPWNEATHSLYMPRHNTTHTYIAIKIYSAPIGFLAGQLQSTQQWLRNTPKTTYIYYMWVNDSHHKIKSTKVLLATE